jgi:formate hydrogenlyase subunit 3/multisubunit Na+/H+ antiporter MnhD subunit
MALASYFLVVFEDEKPEVRNAGRIYLIATHAGTSFLLAFFAILGREADSLEFAAFSGLATLAPATASALFLLALVGFGAKAGLVPMHIWLPEAHPAAPSHVSAIMSGVMIKTGIYGILRALTFFGALPAWWGVLLIGVGLTSGILGVLFALAQHDLKRLLAYHSVENIGIITLGMGVGVWGMGHGAPTVALLGFAGALLHVVNHAAFKGLLFLNAGSVLHATGAREMDHLGGLLKKMPVTGGTFLIAAIAISGLPPLNGFVSEFLILLGSLKGAIAPSTGGAVALLALMAGLVLIGGLAVACFSKAFGVAFLGSPRTEHATHAHEAGLAFSLPMLTLAALCVFIGIAAVVSVRVVLPAAAQLVGVDTSTATSEVASWSSPLARVTLVALIVAGFGGALAWVRMRLLAGRKVETAVTWDCGYEHPNARMQYTATSYAQPLLAIFRAIVRQRTWFVAPRGYLPASGGFHAETPDPFVAQMYRPISAWVGWATSRLHWLQQGRVHVYLLYIFITLVILLVWGVGF